MMMKILKRLAQGGRYSNKHMAAELGVDIALVEQMIGQLQNLKYIEKDDVASCSSGCSGCAIKNSCCSGNSGIEINLWKLTDKGRKAISKL